MQFCRPVGSRSGVMNGSYKVNQASIENFPPFRPFRPISKFLLPILKHLKTNGFTKKGSFHFTEEIVDQQSDFIMCSLDLNSLSTNIPLEYTIEIWTNELFKESEAIQGFSKFVFRELLSLASKD